MRMTDIRDLWPDDIAATSIVPPVSILREQAAILSRKTKQLLRARVETASEGQLIRHVFVISAPAIDYNLELFHMSHEITLYPIDLYWAGKYDKIEDEAQLIEALKKIFGASDTKKLVHSLLAQSRSEQPNQQAEITDEDIPF